MAEPMVRIGDTAEDVEMGDNSADVEEALEALEGADVGEGDAEGDEDEAEDEPAAPKLTYIDYLRSPIIELTIGSGAEQTTLSAHQALLAQSPYFNAAIAEFSPDTTFRRIEFEGEDLKAMGSFLEFLYTGDYFPRRVGEVLEGPSGASTDDGEQLLEHARVYTLAEKLGVGVLKDLAHSKVHRVNSSAKGEIAYARYVYGNTPRDDITIRKPIASFWGQRSHVLRHEAEDEFKQLCLEFPEFGFDVLSHVLDAREKRVEKAREEDVMKSGRKRVRQT